MHGVHRGLNKRLGQSIFRSSDLQTTAMRRKVRHLMIGKASSTLPTTGKQFLALGRL